MTHMPTSGTVTALVITSAGGTKVSHEYDSGMDPGNGAEANRSTFQAALNAVSSLGGGTVRVGPYTYTVGRNGASAYSIDVPSNVTVVCTPGKSVLKHPVLGTSQQVSIMRLNGVSNVTIDGLTFDGNWGATVGVTDVLADWAATTPYSVGQRVNNAGASSPTRQYQCITAGTSSGSAPTGTGSDITDGTVHWMYIGDGTLDPCNQIPGQADANNNGIAVFGSSDILIRNCHFTQIYGDAMWVGQRSSPSYLESSNVTFQDCTADIVARHACTNSGGVDGVNWIRIRADNIRGGVFDTEGGNTSKRQRNVHVEDCDFGAWWLRKDAVFCAACVGPNSLSASEAQSARGYRFTRCQFAGPVEILSSVDVVLDGCRHVLDTSVAMSAAIYCVGENSNVKLINGYVYDRAPSPGNTHLGSILVRYLGLKQRPQNVLIQNYEIHCHSGTGVHAIAIDGSGGEPGESGTATGVTATTLTNTAKSGVWTLNQWAGFRVRMGGAIAAVETNTTTGILSFDAWTTPLGETTTTPAAGAYEILSNEGAVVVEGCTIECRDDGNGHGGKGIYLDSGQFGGFANRARWFVRGNRIWNTQDDGIFVQARSAPNVLQAVELTDNHVYDTQATPTCTAAVRFATSPAIVLGTNVQRIVMRNNGSGTVATLLAGLSGSHRWLVADGLRQEWEGFGAPTFTAPIGTRYWRVDATNASTTLYINNDGATTWTAK